MLSFFRDYITLRKSGLFMASAYAARYLGSRKRHRRALAHYLIVGEQKGYWANPFFDPACLKQGTIPSFASYLRRRDLWDASPSPIFQGAWYRETALAGAFGTHPLVHFWSHGFVDGRNPAPDFDCAFFKDVVGVNRPDKQQVAYETLAASEIAVPFSEKDLRARQARFHAGIQIDVIKRPQDARRPFLVFVQASHTYDEPLACDGRNYDLLVNCYDAPPTHEMRADYVVFQRGTKTTAIHKLLTDYPDIFLAYRAVLFLDDDIEIAPDAIDRLFTARETHGLDLAQAALTEDSFCVFECLKQPTAGRGIRPLTGVEIMMPVLSNRALRAAGFAFGESISGWGVDHLLAAEVRARFGDTIAMVADVVAAHRRPVDTREGAYYQFLKGHGIDAMQELALVALRYGTSTMPDGIRLLNVPANSIKY